MTDIEHKTNENKNGDEWLQIVLLPMHISYKTVTTKTMKHQNHLTLRKLKSKAWENKLDLFDDTKSQFVTILH